MTIPRPRRLSRAVLAVTATASLCLAMGSPAQALPAKKTWRADVRAAMAGSQDYVAHRVDAKKSGEQLAINLDIDNTSIQTHYAYPEPVKPVLRLTQYAHGRGVTILFNTGRYEDQLGGIKKALTNAGYPWAQVCGREHGEDLVTSKQRCRAMYTAAGYTLIANIGNRASDFRGTQDFERRFKLPGYRGALS